MGEKCKSNRNILSNKNRTSISLKTQPRWGVTLRRVVRTVFDLARRRSGRTLASAALFVLDEHATPLLRRTTKSLNGRHNSPKTVKMKRKKTVRRVGWDFWTEVTENVFFFFLVLCFACFFFVRGQWSNDLRLETDEFAEKRSFHHSPVIFRACHANTLTPRI